MAATNQITHGAAALGTNGNTLRDIKPPVEIPSGWAWVFWVLGALAVAALLFWLWRYWQKRRMQEPVIPVVPPHVRAKQKLEEALAVLGQPPECCLAGSDRTRRRASANCSNAATWSNSPGTNPVNPNCGTSTNRRCDSWKKRSRRHRPGKP